MRGLWSDIEMINFYRSEGAVERRLECGVGEQDHRRRAHARQVRARQHRGPVRRGRRERPVRGHRPPQGSCHGVPRRPQQSEAEPDLVQHGGARVCRAQH